MACYPALQKPAYDHSFESGVLEQGNILNMQDREYLRTRVENHCSRLRQFSIVTDNNYGVRFVS